jgi:hypothetical protein
MLWQPIGAAGMNHMARPLSNLAAWPPTHGVLFFVRSFGFAFHEVVVGLWSVPSAAPVLRRCAWWLAGTTTALLLLLVTTPLAGLWFEGAQNLEPAVARLARGALAAAVLLPALQVHQSLVQGRFVVERATRVITLGTAVGIGTGALALTALAAYEPVSGVTAAALSFCVGSCAQSLWLDLLARAGRARTKRAFSSAP